MSQAITRCRICGNHRLETILELGVQKLTGVFPTSPDVDLLGGPLELLRCAPSAGHCGLVQLRHSYPLEAMYGDNYGYRSGLNSSMTTHLASKAAFLTALSKPVPGDLIVDIGSNDGTLLRSYDALYDLLGIDPVARKFLAFYPRWIRVLPEFFSRELWQAQLSGRKAKIITSIAMFYDIERPMEFVGTIRDFLASDGIWHFEQSYLPLLLERCAYDTICHEHIEYYCLRQIQWMIERSDLKIVALQINDVNGGSLAVTVARNEAPYPKAKEEIERVLQAEERKGLEGFEPLHRFRDNVFAHRDRLLKQIRCVQQRGEKLLGYGASTKGNVILQFCGLTTKEIPFIAEVNPEKFGRFTPGSGIPIVSEPEVHAMKPDVLFVLPWHFRQNLIEREEDFLQRGGRLLFPLPDVEFFPQ
jgi:NDP-4-keto-2,6-dideoxyhexose 3-C-methyltransferase